MLHKIILSKLGRVVLARPNMFVPTGQIYRRSVVTARSYQSKSALLPFAINSPVFPMDPNNKPSNKITCNVCSTVYEGCHSCRLYASEFCSFGLEDPRANPNAHDNPSYVDDFGRMATGTIDLDQQVPGFKSSNHMPVDSIKTPEHETPKTK